VQAASTKAGRECLGSLADSATAVADKAALGKYKSWQEALDDWHPRNKAALTKPFDPLTAEMDHATGDGDYDAKVLERVMREVSAGFDKARSK
jgi:hypothetical protein